MAILTIIALDYFKLIKFIFKYFIENRIQIYLKICSREVLRIKKYLLVMED